MTAPLSGPCRETDALLLAFSTDELDAVKADVVRAHLADCVRCRAAFVEVQHVQTLARDQQLNSPALDRYPEFLRRLATQTALQPTAQPAEQPNALALSDKQLPVPAETANGLAAAWSFGNKQLLVRNGFGRGFELRLVARQGGELLHLSAQSLTRVAAAVAGVSVFAAAAGIACFLLFFARPATSPQTGPSAPANVGQPPSPLAASLAADSHWLQTVSGETWSMALWQRDGELQAGFYQFEKTTQAPLPLTPVQLALPVGNEVQRQPSVLPPTLDCAAATDGAQFVIVRAIGQQFYAWRLDPQQNSVSPPLPLPVSGTQPALAWAGDRYLLCWIETSGAAPTIQLLALTRTGEPWSPAQKQMVAATELDAKVGLPSLAVGADAALIVYHRQGGPYFGKLWSAAAGLAATEFKLGAPTRRPLERPFIAVTTSGWLVCWAEADPHRAHIRYARLHAQGELAQSGLLAARPAALQSLDYRWNGNELLLLWAEAGNTRLLQRANLAAGQSLNEPQPLQPAPAFSSADVCFADATGEHLLWHAPQQPTQSLQVEPLAQAAARTTTKP